MNNRTEKILPSIALSDLHIEDRFLNLCDLAKLWVDHKNILSSSHRVNYYEVLLNETANGYLWIDSNKYELHEKSLITISKGQIVKYNLHCDAKGIVISFPEEFIYNNHENLNRTAALELFDSYNSDSFTKLLDEDYSGLADLCQVIKSELKLIKDVSCQRIVNNLFEAFLLLAERNKKNIIIQDSTRNINTLYISEFKRILEDHYKESHSVNYYADLMNITSKKLNKVTSDSLGKSTKKVIEERILLESKRLLVHTAYSIKEIGCSLGFTDPTNFNKFFKKNLFTTPASFRNIRKAELYY